MRTARVKKLVNDVLDSLPRPYTEHVIDDVFFAIEHNATWRKAYEGSCAELGKAVVHNWGGHWIANALGKVGEREVPSRKNRLLGSYSLLDADAPPPKRKPTQAEAAQIMSDYYQQHRGALPTDIRKHRELIIELLMDGVPVEQAFAMVTKNDG